MQLNQVQLGAVALVLAKTILGVTITKLSHYRIAGYLGNHTRRRNA